MSGRQAGGGDASILGTPQPFLAGARAGAVGCCVGFGPAWLRRMRPLPGLGRIVPPACRLAAGARGLGTNRGGMYVEVGGESQIGDRITKARALVAERDRGPFVPTLPVTVLARNLAAGTLDSIGAMPCLGLYTLRQFTDEISDLAVTGSGP